MTDMVELKGGYAQVGMATDSRGGSLMPANFGEVVAFAKVMSRASLALPKHLRDNDGACMAVTMQALRWEMDPFAVANKTYSVNDRLAYEAQLVAAVVHTRAPIKGRPNYAYSGEGPTRRCTVTCEMVEGGSREYETPMFSQITVKNSPLWKSDPDQQLGYFAIRSWARRYTPEVILGVYDREELIEAGPMNVTPKGNTGLTERLAARAAASGEGFTSLHGDVIDATVEDEPVEPLGATVEVESEADEVVEPNEPEAITEALSETVEFTREQLEDWAQGIEDAAGRMKNKAQVKAMWADEETVRRQTLLKLASLGRAQDLHSAVLARIKALTV